MHLYGGALGGTVPILTPTPIILSGSPYLWGANVGLMNVDALIGSLLAFAACFVSADLSLKVRANKDGIGFAEPMARLPTIFLAPFTSATTGIWTVGFCAANPSPTAWVGMEFGTGMVRSIVRIVLLMPLLILHAGGFRSDADSVG